MFFPRLGCSSYCFLQRDEQILKTPSCLAGCYPKLEQGSLVAMQYGAVRPRVAAGRQEARWHLASRVCPYLWSVPSCACWAGDGEPQDPELQNCPKTLLFEWAQGQKLPFRARGQPQLPALPQQGANLLSKSALRQHPSQPRSPNSLIILNWELTQC